MPHLNSANRITMKRKILSFSNMLAVLLTFAVFEARATDSDGRKPNILWIISDQLNWDYLSYTGNRYVHTPNMDRLCKEGIRFNRAYAINPVCLPSRVGMITGNRPSRFGVHVPKGITVERTDMVAYAREKNLAGKFQQEGYKTYYGGKTHFGSRGYEFFPQDIGFDVYANQFEYRGVDCVPKAIATLNAHAANHASQPFFMVASLMNPHDICYAHIRDNRYDIEKIADRTKGTGWKALLRESVLENLKIPPGEAGAGGYEPVAYYLRQAPPLPDNYRPQTDEPGIISGEGQPGMAAAFGRYRGIYDDTDWLLHRYAYCRFVEDFDRKLGLLLDGLEASGMYDDTVIIFTSDHGESNGSHQMAGKGLFYDEVCHIPLIVAYPAFKGGTADTINLVSVGLDMIPTLFELAGVAADPELEGLSFAPALRQPGHRLNRDAVPVEFSTGLGIITHDFYYGIYYSGNKNNEQLYDLRKRPLQVANDALDPVYRDILIRHRKLFSQLNGKTLEHYGNPVQFSRYLSRPDNSE
jgi:arylsulfatase A-like enzyme